MKRLAVLAFALACVWSASAQQHRCQFVSFTVELSENQKFERELGGSIWFTVSPDDGSWTMRIGPGREPRGPLDLGWSLDRSWTPEWQLGQTYERDAEAAMKSSPRHLWFAVTNGEYSRLRTAQFREMSSDSRVVLSGENDSGKVMAEIHKGLATVVISGYRLSDTQRGKRRNVLSAMLKVVVNTPSDFPLIEAVPCACPTEQPASPHP